MNYYNNLADFFYETVKKNTHSSALNYKNYSVSYSDLNKQSNKIANYFLSIGVKRFDVVGILNTKETLGYASMLACLKIGAAYTNIDDLNPLVRTESIIDTCNPKLIIADSDSLGNGPIESLVLSKKIKFFQPSNFHFQNFSDQNLQNSKDIIGTAPAYIMFTSGSTGKPKGVTVSHANVLSFLGWSINRYEVTSIDVFAQVSPMYFDNSVFDFYTALFSGASLVPIKREVAKSPGELVNLVDSMRCTIWFSVPSLLVYLQTMKVLNEKTFQSVRIFTFGGEGFPKNELKKLFNLYSEQSKLINVYGPTEGTCICSSYEVVEKDFEDMKSLAPIGSINQNFDYLVLDNQMEKVGFGENGELCLAGPNVALGYYNDIDRTAQNFIQNPTISTHKDIIYRSGDIVREKDGLLWFVGRIDNQIKHMGYRIELEEIESALNSLQGITESAVVYHRAQVNYGKIVAFVGSKIVKSESQLKNALRQLLPEYMIPSIINIESVLPKNQNGKIDKKALNVD